MTMFLTASQRQQRKYERRVLRLSHTQKWVSVLVFLDTGYYFIQNDNSTTLFVSQFTMPSVALPELLTEKP